MKILKFIFIFFILVWFFSCTTPKGVTEKAPLKPAEKAVVASRSLKKRVGVVAFEDKTAYGKGRLGTSASDILTTELFRTGLFIVVERAQIDKVLREQQLSQTGIIQQKSAVQAGQILGLNAIIMGSISQFGVRVEGMDFGVYKEKVQTAECTVDVRVVDTTTGQVIFADAGKGKYEKRLSELFGMGQRGGYDETMGQNALRASIAKFMDQMVAKISETEWSARIADIEGDTVYINAGKRTGINIGDRLLVYQLGKEILDPQTQVPIGRAPGRLKGEIEVTGFFGEDGAITIKRSGAGFLVNDIVKIKEPSK
jgi:curli biogenesis system outer membrane secretion channel CsgG